MRALGITLIAITIISCASSLPPVEPTPEMMEQADRIILTIEENPTIAYKNLQKHLGNKGFTVIQSNNKPLTLETKYRTFGPLMFGVWGSYSMKITASVNDSSIQFHARLDSGTQVENAGGKNSPVKSGWNKLVEIAKEFPHQQMYYSRN
ncbi:hypothetical protein [Fodinibius sp.]|uniref:hypothetical protein n=1 Tax=Fodinibius sp. TaxID=1872440 RepID=UPI002ACDD008|nr:hypothetical protein [Fodinibius sp.]MDZ7658257.1 hypothetical protein [Fodinibius sp.]